MPTLAIRDMDLKLREPLEAAKDSQRWSVRCMHLDCAWKVEGLLSEASATTAAKLHANSTRHPVKLRAVIEFECGTVRADEVR